MEIRIDCYYGVLKKYHRKYPKAHFELIMRKDFNHILSPSWSLVKRYEKGRDWEQYKIDFLKEIYSQPEAIAKLVELKNIAKEKLLFLICFEKSYIQCHRRIVKWLMEHIKDNSLPLLDEVLEYMKTDLKGTVGVDGFLTKRVG